MDTLKGRAAPELAAFTFPLSKITVHYHLLSQFTLGHIESTIQKKFLPPTPPMFTYETDDGTRTEPNPADLGYQEALNQHKLDLMWKVIDAMIELGVEVEVDHDRLTAIRTTLDAIGMPMDETSDKVAYIKHCCIVDASELMLIAQRMKGVTEEAIQAKQDTFPGGVQTEGDQPVSSAVVGPVV